MMKMDHKLPQPLAALLCWGVLLWVSQLPDILFQEMAGSHPAWLFWSKIGLLAALLAGAFVLRELRSLWLFAALVLAVYLVEWGVGLAGEKLRYQSWLAGMHPFVQELGRVQLPRAAASLLVTLISLVLFGRFDRFFLSIGQLSAPARPIPLVLTRPPAWHKLGPAIAGAMSLGLVVFVIAFGRPPSLAALASAAPLLPFVLLFAANNAYGEELLYRAPWLAALELPVGPTQALLMTAVYFGIGHFYGVPYGVLGCVMAFIPGWLMGKAMLETRGFFWAWLIHVCMDTVIFSFMALGAVTPGG